MKYIVSIGLITFTLSLFSEERVVRVIPNVQSLDELQAEFIVLEKHWDGKSHEYFVKAEELYKRVSSNFKIDYVKRLCLEHDIATAIFAKSRYGIEFGEHSQTVRNVQIERAKRLNWFYFPLDSFGDAWPAARRRRAGLFMKLRSDWLTLRDPSLDNEKIMSYSVFPAPSKEFFDEVNAKNKVVSFQYELRELLYNRRSGLGIENFLVSVYATEPHDFRELNELLLLGNYTPAERKALLYETAVLAGVELPEVVSAGLEYVTAAEYMAPNKHRPPQVMKRTNKSIPATPEKTTE